MIRAWHVEPWPSRQPAAASWPGHHAGTCTPDHGDKRFTLPTNFSTNWARSLALAAVAWLLSGCSLVSLGYARLPDLTVWWVKRQVTLDNAQAAQVRQDMQAVLEWHRHNQLANLADTLQYWQSLVDEPLTGDQVCTEFAKLRTPWDLLLRQATPGMATLAKSLTPAQRDEIQATQTKALQTFRQDYWPDSRSAAGSWLPAAWAATSPADTRLSQLKDRYARLYGDVNANQTDALRRAIAQSSFDPARTLAEREQRSLTLQASLRTIAAAATSADAQKPVQDWLASLTNSPTPGYARYSQTLVNESCEQFARVHAAATPAQIAQARRVLAGYEADLRQQLPRR